MFDNGNAPNVIEHLDNYIQIHCVPRSLKIDQACCIIGNLV